MEERIDTRLTLILTYSSLRPLRSFSAFSALNPFR